MNKTELISLMAARLDIRKKQAEDFVESFTSIVTEILEDEGEVTISGFGTFSSRIRAARRGVDPRDPSKSIDVPAVLVPKFKAGKALKDSLKAAQKRRLDGGAPEVVSGDAADDGDLVAGV